MYIMNFSTLIMEEMDFIKIAGRHSAPPDRNQRSTSEIKKKFKTGKLKRIVSVFKNPDSRLLFLSHQKK